MMVGSDPGPPRWQKHYGRPRLRWLVEEAEELPVRVLVQLRERGRPSPTPRLYVRCPRCEARRLSLFLVRDVLGCRGCLGLRYLSQGKGQWNGDVMRAVGRRYRALRARPGPKGRRYRAWERRHQRLGQAFDAWNGGRGCG